MIYRLIKKDNNILLEPTTNDKNKLHQIEKIKSVYFDGDKVKEVKLRFNKHGIIVIERIVNFE